MAGVGKRTYLRDVNPYLICPLCRGYLIDATTVVECLHSFCRSCILKHLNTEAHCPSCKHVLNKAKPNIKADKALQDIAYKLVPGLYHREMRKRREFYKKHPEHADSATPEQRGEDVSGRLIFAPEDAVSLSLEYLPPGTDPLTILISTNDADPNQPNASNHNNNNASNSPGNSASNRRYLQCPALVTIAHLKKFLALKYSVDMTRYTIEICHRRAPLPEHWTLMDVAYIYAWKRNAPMRFFYRVAQEEQRLEAPPHDRPSTPGLGASLPPLDTNDMSARDNSAVDTLDNDVAKADIQRVGDSDAAACVPDDRNVSDKKKLPFVDNSLLKVVEKIETTSKTVDQKATPAETVPVTTSVSTSRSPPPLALLTMPLSTSVATSTTMSVSTTSNPIVTTTNETPMTDAPTTTEEGSNKQIKTPIKILKNPDGRYEVLRSPPALWNAKDQLAAHVGEAKSSSPEFSVVSIGDGQNSNGVKITLKQCSPGSSNSSSSSSSTNSKKPKIINSVTLRCGQLEKDPAGALLMQQLQKERERMQQQQQSSPPDKQEKQKRRVTFVDRTTPTKTPVSSSSSSNSNNSGILPKAAIKKPAELHEKKQFLQGFQLTAKESTMEYTVPDSSSKTSSTLMNLLADTVPTESKDPIKKEPDAKKETSCRTIESSDGNEKRLITENVGVGTNINVPGSKRIGTANILPANIRTTKPLPGLDNRIPINHTPATPNGSLTTGNAKMDVYTFPNDPPVVPAGAVKRKCPPGVPILEIKRKRQQQPATPTLTAKKPQSSPTAQTPTKSPRKCITDMPMPRKRPVNMVVPDPGPSRLTASPNTKASPNPMLSNDTRNLLDGCGLNIPASLSITLTAPKSPGNHGASIEPHDAKDNRKNLLGKVSPSITLNDRSVDPHVLKALKAGQIRMSAPPRPRQLKPNEPGIQPRQTAAGKRKREQEARDILDLSATKKMDMHPLRIPQLVAKRKPKSPTREMPTISDQAQVVTLMGGHRYYRAPPGSLTPAAHRVTDCPLPTPGRTPVYAPTGLSGPLGGNRTSTNLSSVFPSLQSLYALSQAPNLQQFQMDARLRLPRTENTMSTIGNSDEANNANGNNGNHGGAGNMPAKTHLAAQCAPIKPARSSVAPLAVPIAKQQSHDRPTSCLNRPFVNDANKGTTFRGPESHDSTDSTQRLTVQTRYTPHTESANSFSPRSTVNCSNGSVTNNEKPHSSPAQEQRVETNGETVSKPDEALRPQQAPQSQNPQQHRHEAASPRVSSTASPSPPPGDGNSASNQDEVDHRTTSDDSSVGNTSSRSQNEVPTTSTAKSGTGPEVTSSKSPASPDSSSITVESTGNNANSDQRVSSPSQAQTKPSEVPKPDNGLSEESTTDPEKETSPVTKPSDGKQLTSEMLQKRLLAAFPTNEWANNPIAAEHLGNFLKSLNASMKAEGRTEIDTVTEKVESKEASSETNNDASPQPRKEVGERS